MVTAISSGRGRDDRADFPIGGVARRPHHLRAARGMHVDHPRAQPRGRTNRACDGVGDVVKLQIEEDAIASRGELLDDRRPQAGEQATADLETADRAAQRIGQRPRLSGRVDVESD